MRLSNDSQMLALSSSTKMSMAFACSLLTSTAKTMTSSLLASHCKTLKSFTCSKKRLSNMSGSSGALSSQSLALLREESRLLSPTPLVATCGSCLRSVTAHAATCEHSTEMRESAHEYVSAPAPPLVSQMLSEPVAQTEREQTAAREQENASEPKPEPGRLASALLSAAEPLEPVVTTPDERAADAVWADEHTKREVVFVGAAKEQTAESVDDDDTDISEREMLALKAVAADAEDFQKVEDEDAAEQTALFEGAREERQPRARIFRDDEILSAAFEYHRRQGFPYRELSPALCMQEIEELSRVEGKALIHTRLGYKVADVFHHHRMHAAANGMKSPLSAFEDDKKLAKAIRLEYKLAGKARVWPGGILTLVNGTQACSNFRPGFAAYLYREFAPDNATVLDTSTGYGGRLIGAVASQKVAKYIGIDPNVPTYEANIRMARALRFEHLIELINLPAEDVEHELVRERCDFSFTSPPYFAKELYSQDDTQSWVRYKTGEQWRDKFLQAMLALTFASLKPGAFAIVNIADVKLKKKVYPLVEWTIELGKRVGFEYLRTEKFPMMTRFGAHMADEVATEPVIVFRKQ
jgi:hypothetical protein